MFSRAVAALLATVTGLPVMPPSSDPIRDAQWHLECLNVAVVHGISTGTGVTVGVVDTGVDGNHPDLSGSFVGGTDLTGGEVANGLADLNGHGTHMAGIVAAHGR